MPGVSYPCLAPNIRGYLDARVAGAEDVAVFTSAGETFCKRNTNCTIEESLKRCRQILETAHSDEVRVRGYVSCIFEDPYDGPTPTERVVRVTKELLDMGCYEVSLGDTTGVGTPGATFRLLSALLKEIPADKMAMHFHDTYGQALANILVGLQLGLNIVDSSVGGLGGCPYARGATGNVATEDVVYMLHGLGIDTGVDLGMLVEIGQYINAQLGRKPVSRVNIALWNKKITREEEELKKATADMAVAQLKQYEKSVGRAQPLTS